MSQKELLAQVTELKELKAMAQELADRISDIEDAIKAEMAARETDKLVVGPFKLSWTPYKSTRLDSKALKAEMPDIWGRYSVTTETAATVRFEPGKT